MVVSVVPEKSEVLDFLMKLESQGVISFWGPEWKSTEAKSPNGISAPCPNTSRTMDWKLLLWLKIFKGNDQFLFNYQ